MDLQPRVGRQCSDPNSFERKFQGLPNNTGKRAQSQTDHANRGAGFAAAGATVISRRSLRDFDDAGGYSGFVHASSGRLAVKRPKPSLMSSLVARTNSGTSAISMVRNPILLADV